MWNCGGWELVGGEEIQAVGGGGVVVNSDSETGSDGLEGWGQVDGWGPWFVVDWHSGVRFVGDGGGMEAGGGEPGWDCASCRVSAEKMNSAASRSELGESGV